MQPPEKRRQDSPRNVCPRVMPHPATVMLLWVCMTIAMQSLHGASLIFCGLLVAILALMVSPSGFHVLLRRTRWIMLVLLLVYCYATPGEPLMVQAGIFSPTREGMLDGMLQLGRLVCALSGLSVVLGLLTQQQLIGGIYALARPMRPLGISSERIAVRLALTLQYAETAMQDTAAGWQASITRSMEPLKVECGAVELHAAPFTLFDGLLIAVSGALLAWVLL
jgi:energy-coupling factor transport system permease protein